MLLTAIMAAVGAGGVGFYLWFLAGLLRERKVEWVGYWIHLELDSDHDQAKVNEITTLRRVA